MNSVRYLQASNIQQDDMDGLHWQTHAGGSFEPQRFSGAVAKAWPAHR
jgi:hypothetical protein